MISADDYRVPSERFYLKLAIIITLLLLLFVVGISWGVVLIFVLVAVFYVKIKQGQLLGNSIKITGRQFPELFNQCVKVSERLSMQMPEVYIIQNPVLNAYALGVRSRFSVVLHSALVESLDEEEMNSILGHEFSHIKCGHTNWLVFTSLKDAIYIPIVSDILGVIFNSWSRRAEYTCDRGGLLASRKVNKSISALAKIAVGRELFDKMNLDAYQQQLAGPTQDDLTQLSEALQTHPHIVNRIHGLHYFSRSKNYHDMINRQSESAQDPDKSTERNGAIS